MASPAPIAESAFAEVVTAFRAIKVHVAELTSKFKLKQQPRIVAVQEFVSKAAELPDDIQWHFIGHLQTNKVKDVLKVKNLWVVETLDSTKLATKLNQACVQIDRKDKLRVLVQVNVSAEASKSGVPPADAPPLVQHVVSNCPQLVFAGLMTIGALDVKPRADDFALLAKVRDDVATAIGIDRDQMELSMGMSDSYQLAMEHGSTNLRIGSTIFGHRDYSKNDGGGGAAMGGEAVLDNLETIVPATTAETGPTGESAKQAKAKD